MEKKNTKCIIIFRFLLLRDISRLFVDVMYAYVHTWNKESNCKLFLLGIRDMVGKSIHQRLRLTK